MIGLREIERLIEKERLTEIFFENLFDGFNFVTQFLHSGALVVVLGLSRAPTKTGSERQNDQSVSEQKTKQDRNKP